jgi:hypothetical protein
MEKYSNFTLFYPQYAIKKKLEDLRIAQENFDDFMLRMLSVFKFDPKHMKDKET